MAAAIFPSSPIISDQVTISVEGTRVMIKKVN